MTLRPGELLVRWVLGGEIELGLGALGVGNGVGVGLVKRGVDVW